MKAKGRQFQFLWVLLIFCLYHLPTILFGKKAYYNAFDSLDSYVTWYRIVTQGGYAWAPPFSIITPFMGGVPKFTLVSTYNIYYWLNLILPTFNAYQILTWLISFVALTGMWLLSRKHLGMDRISAGFLALSFAFTPFLQTWVFSIAGQPLLLYAILNIRKQERNSWNWLIVAFFPFTSNFQSAGVFILFGLGLLILYDKYKKRPVSRLVTALIVLLVVFSATKIDLIENILGGSGFESHRMEMRRFSTPVTTCMIVAARYFLLGNIDVALSLHSFVLLPFTLLTFCFFLVKNKKLPIPLFLTLTVISLICVYIGALQWEPVVNLRNQSDLLRMYSLERFHIFLQLLWHVATAQAILLVPVPFRKRLVTWVCALQLIVCFAYQPGYYATFFSKIVRIQPYHYIFRYEDYYAEEMFARIKSYIPQPSDSYRVASIGIPPAIPQYNGFRTIDGYSSNYPLTYKHAFRKIIATELEKNEVNKGFFDYWGSQCIIVYDQGTGFFDTQMTKYKTPGTRDITLSPVALKALSCSYILSAETISDPEKSGLQEVATFESKIWKVILYKVR
ncbi:DUF6044 family protein [Dyadobacter aurulentus]|uniref:DUF6044 family protein n=1 Tax=Dyadobacter sp. UC 10 TaxID=2605428 RepID=UPI0011F1D5EE|nr:DUF6044 family protein [Dyadobacter sp. UC 10]KAA0992348.1 hypothetical protein FXO21_20265 [Dyadobacter sp. UC 10]